jgi:hypothetical protein
VGGLGLGLTLEIAQQHRQHVLFRQPRDFFVQDLAPIVARYVPRPIFDMQITDGSLAFSTVCGILARLDGDPIGDPMEPAAERIAASDRPRLTNQDQECGLEGIFGPVRVPKHGPARFQDHGPMTLD